MKSIFNWMLIAPLMIVPCMGITACSDDDDKNNSQKQEQADENHEDALTFWNVVSQLTSSDSYTEDYLSQTFEPNIGVAEEGNEMIRVVPTNTMQAAAASFNSLTGANISENTTEYTYSDPAVGTLTYRKLNDGRSWAAVDVYIKQMPHLQQIIYRDGDQMGTNGSFNGVAYYRFGDVVKKDNDYWICVRPAFGPEKKQDSHWITVSPLPEKNLKKCTKGGKTWTVPTGLGANLEQMENLAEMLYAIIYPEDWYTNVKDYNVSVMFHDFDKDKRNYHNFSFWKNVRKNWRDKDLFQTLFGVSEEDIKEAIDSYGLNFIYKGYSWWTFSSWNLTLWQANYSKENLKKETLTEKEVDMNGKNTFSFGDDYRKNMAQFAEFFGDGNGTQLRWVVRFAKGKELTKGYDEQEKLSLCEDIYTYYPAGTQYKNMTPEITFIEGTKSVGNVIGLDGKFYATAQDAYWANNTPAALILYMGKPGSVATQWDPQACGLAVRVFEGGQRYWGINGKEESLENGISCISSINELDKNSDLTGYANTQKMKDDIKNFPAGHISHDNINSKNFSPWFLPSVGDMYLAFSQIAENAKTINPDLTDTNLEVFQNTKEHCFSQKWVNDLLYEMYDNTYVPFLDTIIKSGDYPQNFYWTSTQQNNEYAWVVTISDELGVSFEPYPKRQSTHVLHFLAFK